MMLANRVRELTTTSGASDITLAGALAGHVRFRDAFAVGDAVSYVIEDGDNYEIGTGTMLDADTLARTTVLETLVDGVLDRDAPAPISLSGNARVFCAATAEFLTRSEIGTSTDEPFKLKANDTVYLSLEPGGDIRATGRLITDAGAKIGLQNGADGGSGQGIFLRDTGDSNWGIYMASSASGRSLSDGTPCASLDGRTNYLLRNRVPALPGNAFAWENSAEQCLMSLTADTGDLHTLGHAVVGGSVFSEDLRRTGDSDRLIVSGGATTTSAANIVLYGSSHATNANDIEFRHGPNVVGVYDASAGTWGWSGLGVTGVGSMTLAGKLSANAPRSDSAGEGAVQFSNNRFALRIDSAADRWLHLDRYSANAWQEIPIQSWDRQTGNTVINAVLSVHGGCKVSVQGGTDGTSAKGIFLNATNDRSSVIYASTAGPGKSAADGTACVSLDGRVGYHTRVRIADATVSALVVENSMERCLLSVAGDTGNLHTKGSIHSGSDIWVAGGILGANTPIAGVTQIVRGTVANDLIISGGSAFNQGANIRLRGESHATEASDILFAVDGTSKLTWDNSADRWYFHNNTLSGVRYLLRGLSNDAFLVSGGDVTSLGANLALFGDTHATNAGDVRFRTNTTTTLMYDHSAKVWNFNASNFLTQGRVNIGPTSFLPWYDAYDSLHIGATGSIMAYGSGTNTYISDNAYYDGTNFKRIVEEGAATHRLFEGTHTFRVAASDVAGSSITWIDALSIAVDGDITAAGNLIVGGVVKSLAVATGNRPSAASVGAGATMFDTTLNKPIWSDGSQWVDATGAAA